MTLKSPIAKTIFIPKYSFFICFLLIMLLGNNLQAQSSTWYQDSDNDGWGNQYVSQTSTTKPVGYVRNNKDCNDHTFHKTIWESVGVQGFSAGTAFHLSMTLSPNGLPYVAYRDGAHNNKITVQKYNGTTWTIVGSAGFSDSTCEHPSIIIDKSNTPYVAFTDVYEEHKLTVKKFNGINWVTVGSAGFSDASAQDPTIVLDNNSIPYVSYRDLGTVGNGGITMKKFDGSNWVTLGAEGFSGNILTIQSPTALAIDNSNTPYVCYQQPAIGFKASSSKYDGAKWVSVGVQGFTASHAYELSLAINYQNTPYLGYRDLSNSEKLTVKKYDGSNWITVGNAGFSAGKAGPTITFDGFGTPYVSYRDGGNGHKATVKRYDGTSWVTVGNAGFSAGTVSRTSIAINDKGLAYVGYTDGASGGKATVMIVAPEKLGNPTIPMVTASKINIGDPVTLSINSGQLNDANSWYWYIDNCGGTSVIPLSSTPDGSSITVKPQSITKYFVRGEGDCISLSDNCGELIIVAFPALVGDLNNGKTNVSVYPNPTKRTFNVELLNKGNYEITVVNTNGVIVYEDKIVNEQQKSITLENDLPQGIYTIHITGENDKSVGKVTIIR